MTYRPDPDSTHDALAGCGDRLRTARLAAGLSVDEVASRLHMPARVVRSLEAEDWARLGAPVFVRGQVRSYSRLLGLMTAPMMEALDVGPVEPSKLVSRTHIPKAQWWAEQIGRRLVYIVLTLSLAIPAWVATRQHLSGSAESTTPLDTPIDPTAQVQQAESPAAPRTVVASMAPITAKQQAKSMQVEADIILRTSGESWLEVTGVDGAPIEKTLLPAGSERRYAAAQVQRLTIGNAAAVELESRGLAVDLERFAAANVARFEVSSDGSLAPVD